MKSLSLQMIRVFGRTIDRIPKQRMSQTCHMHANLVRTSGFQTAFYVRCIPKTLQHLIMGHGFLAVLMIDGHFFTVDRVPSDRSVHRSFVFLKIPLHNCTVSSLNTVFLELLCKVSVGSVFFTDKKCPCRILVDSVHDSGS